MAVPRYRGIRDWHYRATACFMALPRPWGLPVLMLGFQQVGWRLAWLGMVWPVWLLPRSSYRATAHFKALTTAQPNRAVYRVPRYRGPAVALPRATEVIDQ